MRRGCLMLLWLALLPPAWASNQISDTLHNLSVSGPGLIRSQTVDQVCVFCHTPHSGRPDAPLWNRRSGGYTQYQSSTADALPGKPSGSSALCLSCHDGTIALGELLSPPGRGRFGANDLRATFLRGRANLGTDLSDDHPVGIRYEPALQLTDPELLDPGTVELPLRDGEIHCITCHDAHSSEHPPFLHKPSLNGELCTSCHLASGPNWDWESSSHARSTRAPQGKDPWPERKPAWKGQTVAENACMNCHAPHNAATPARLVKGEEEKTCFACHDGSLARGNVRGQFQKFYRHPVEMTPSTGHDTARRESPLGMPLHVECEDCHNPHASREDDPMISFNPAAPLQGATVTAPFVNGRMAGVSGLDVNGNPKEASDFQYEVCFKCHGVPGKSACDNRRCGTATTYDMERQDGTYNIRDKVAPENPALVSWHPLTQNNPANDGEVPSLRNDIPLNRETSRIYCTDCHSSDFSPAAGGNGPTGPHGSSFEGLLALDYEFDPDSGAFAAGERLCLKCHDEGSLFADVSFLHRQHVREWGKTCINCHDPHGSAEYPHLLNFLLRANVSGRTYEITGAGGFADPTWMDNGPNRGSCWMNCHGVVHDGSAY